MCEWDKGSLQSPPVRDTRIWSAHPTFIYQRGFQPFQPILKHFTLSVKKQYIVSSKNWMLGVQVTCQLSLEILGLSFSGYLEPACSVLHPTSLEGINHWSGQEMGFEMPLIHLAFFYFFINSSFLFFPPCLCPEKKVHTRDSRVR